MIAPDRQRDGGPFTAGAVCPHCGYCDVHLMRVPNPEPPRLISAGKDREEIIVWAGQSVQVIDTPPDLYDRWDERPFEVVRTCTSCGYEWGQR